VSSFFSNFGRSRVADYETQRGFSPSTRVASSSRFSLPRDFGVEDLSQYAEEDLPGAIYRDEEDPFAPTASNTTSARVTPWNLLFPTRTESPLPRTPSPISRTSLPESYERTRLASPASTSSLDALAQVAAVAPRSVTPELQYPDPLEITQSPGRGSPFRAHLRSPVSLRLTVVPRTHAVAATPRISNSVASG
jgi:hypothetical protein